MSLVALAVHSPSPVHQGRARWVVVAASLVAVLALGLWLQTNSQPTTVNAQNGSAPAAAAPVAPVAVTDMRDLATELDLFNEHIIDSIDETSLSLHYYDTPSAEPLEGLLQELGFSPDVLDRIVNAQAGDGTQTAAGAQAMASWTYEPVDGLSVVIELTD